MTGLALIAEGGGSGTWVASMACLDPGWSREKTIDPRSTGVDPGESLAALLASLGRPVAPVSLVLAALSVADTADSAMRIATTLDLRLRQAGSPARMVLVLNDIVPLLEWRQRPEAVAIWGTGTGFAAHDGAGKIRRCSGAEYMLSDEGGGFDIGLQGLRAATRGIDGRGPTTSLIDAAVALGGGSFAGLHPAIYGESAIGIKERVAAFAVDVVDAASAGDPAAVGILSRAASEIAAGIRAVSSDLTRSDTRLRLVGSIFCSASGLPLRLVEDELEMQRMRFESVIVDPDGRGRVSDLAREVLSRATRVDEVVRAAAGLPVALVRSDEAGPDATTAND